MATFSSNSVRQLLLLTQLVVEPLVSISTTKTVDGEMYLKFINANTQTVATPLIPISAIKSVKGIGYAPKVLKKDTITFDTPVVGQQYQRI